MSYRAAAEAAYLLACDDDVEVAKIGVRLLSDLAEKKCYSAVLGMLYLHATGECDEQRLALARMWAMRAKSLHSTLTDADDLRDAGGVCKHYADWLETTEHDALFFWGKAGSLGSGHALWEICDATRGNMGTNAWFDQLAMAAALGSSQAMVELAGQDGVRGTEQELTWLRAAAALGNLRAEEMLQC